MRRSWPGLLLIVASLPLLLLLSVPLATLVRRVDIATLRAVLAERDIQQAISLSLITTSFTAVICVILGTPLAYLLARRRFRGRLLLDTLIDLPMVLPPSVAGIALLVAFGRRGFFGPQLTELGIELAFSRAAVVVAQVFVAAPYYVKSTVVGFSSVERELEYAAAIDGANTAQVFRFITLPLAAPALIGGLIMTWARALGEFGATIIFAGNFPGRTQTMPLAIYLGFELELRIAITLSVVLLAISFAVLFIVKGLLRARLLWQ